MLYNFTHTHIRDLRLRLHTEERLVNLLKLIGRPLKMIKLKGAITEKKMVSLNNQKIFKKWLLCKRHPLFIYFNKQGFTLIMHDNACPRRSIPLVSQQPRLGVSFSVWFPPKQPAPLFLRLVVFSPVRGETAEEWEVHAYLPPLSGGEEEGGERQSPSPSLGHPVYESGRLLVCTWVFVLNPPEVDCDDPSHPREEKMEA